MNKNIYRSMASLPAGRHGARRGKNKKILFIFLLVVLSATAACLIHSPNANAAFTYTPMEKIPGFESGVTSFPTYIINIYKFGIWIVGIAALLMIAVGGFMYITSAGNTSSMGKAKGIITDAIVGLIMALSAWLILNTINPALLTIPQLVGLDTSTPNSSSAGTNGLSSSQQNQIQQQCNDYCNAGGTGTTTVDQCKSDCVATKTAQQQAQQAAQTQAVQTACRQYWNKYYGNNNGPSTNFDKDMASCDSLTATNGNQANNQQALQAQCEKYYVAYYGNNNGPSTNFDKDMASCQQMAQQAVQQPASSASGTPLPTSANSSNAPAEIQQKAKQYAAQNGVPENVALNMLNTESGGVNGLTSSKGAAGLLQLMPGTAKDLGVTDPMNVDQNLNAGYKYVDQLYNKYGDWGQAVAAYNWGTGNMDSYLKTGVGMKGQPMPAETRNYVNKVMGSCSFC